MIVLLSGLVVVSADAADIRRGRSGTVADLDRHMKGSDGLDADCVYLKNDGHEVSPPEQQAPDVVVAQKCSVYDELCNDCGSCWRLLTCNRATCQQCCGCDTKKFRSLIFGDEEKIKTDGHPAPPSLTMG